MFGETLGKKLSQKKSRRFQHLLVNRFDDFFNPIKVSPNTLKDAITGEELEAGSQKLDKDDNRIDALMVNKSTYQQIELGKKLKHTDYWILSRQRLNYLDEDAYTPGGLGLYNYFINETKLKSQENELNKSQIMFM